MEKSLKNSQISVNTVQAGVCKLEGTRAIDVSFQVYCGIMADLEAHRVVPGQRLVETELAQRYGVGRNAVREAMQRLVARGVVDTRPNKSPSVRQLDLDEMMEILNVASAMSRLAVRAAAVHYQKNRHRNILHEVFAELDLITTDIDFINFGKVRRKFYRALLFIGSAIIYLTYCYSESMEWKTVQRLMM